MGRKTIKPIIKWTGGKYSEYQYFKKYIPEFENYYEPFFGSGGVFFQLQPSKRSFINDKSTDLFNFYSQLNDNDFRETMFFYGKTWDETHIYIKDVQQSILELFNVFLENKIEPNNFSEEICNIINKSMHLKKYENLFSFEFIGDKIDIKSQIVISLTSKLKKIKKICIKENKIFTNDEMFEHICVGIRSGFYTQIRTIMNNSLIGKIEIPLAQYTACWYLVREFCFSAMFRFNKEGEFNIPYGGISYNKKKLFDKIEKIFADDVINLFKNTIIGNYDFEEFLTLYPPTSNDFIFIDPPYDSTFSEYDQLQFNDKDQIRLSQVLNKTKGKWMVVIKETDFIRKIYTDINAHIYEFDKKYMSNMRSRNDRDVRHLIITNYDKL